MLISLAILFGILIGYKIAKLSARRRIPKLQAAVKIPPSKVCLEIRESVVEDKIWFESALEFVFKFSEALSLNLERQSVIQFINEGTRNILYVEKCVLLLWNKETRSLRVAGTSGLSKDLRLYTDLNNQESISNFVLQQRKTLVVNDLENEAYFRKINREEYLKKSFISVPLVFQDETLGVLHACDKRFTNEFTKRDELLISNIARISAIALKNVSLYGQIQQDYLKTITALASAIDARDSYTMHHSENVARYSVELAKKMGCKDYEIKLLRQAALLNDIGKIGIKDYILLKPEPLTPEEFKIVQQHPVKGEEIANILTFLKEAAKLIRHHHERFDGAGYPDGIGRYNIELGARILAVADVFDAITTDRPYRKAFSFQEALEEIRKNEGTQFDPEVVEHLSAVINEYGEKALGGS